MRFINTASRLFLFAATVTYSQVQYTSTTLSPPPGYTASVASTINEAGIVAGQASNPGPAVPVVWTNGVPRILPVPSGYVFQYIRDMNNTGQVLGSVTSTTGSWVIVWTNDVPTVLPADYNDLDPESINDSGYVLMNRRAGGGGPRLWNGSAYVPLNLQPYEAGRPLGASNLTNTNTFLFWNGQSFFVANANGPIRMFDLPPANNLVSLTMNSNEELYVVDRFQNEGYFFDSTGTRQPIQIPAPVVPTGGWLNEAGQVFIGTTTSGQGVCHWIWHYGAAATPNGCNPNIYAWQGRRWWNKRGQLLAYSGLGFVLTPNPTLTTSVYPAGAGTVTPATGQQAPGANVTVQANAASGYVFTGFGGALSGTGNPQQLTMGAADTTVFANFAPVLPVLVAQVAGSSNLSGTETVQLRLRNTGSGPAIDASVTGITGIQVLSGSGAVTLASGVPFQSGTIAPGGASGNSAITLNWSATVNLVRFTVQFRSNNGNYSGSTTVTAAR